MSDSVEHWLKQIHDHGLAHVENQLPTLSTRQRLAPDQAIEIYQRNQEEMRQKQQDSREDEMLRHARHSKWAAWIAIPISVIALFISVWVANLPK